MNKVFIGLGVLLLLLIRVAVVIPSLNTERKQKVSQEKLKDKLLVVLLGSGGHTGEMLRLMETVDVGKLGKVKWIVSSGDTTSAVRLRRFLESRTTPQSLSSLSSQNTLLELKRARRVGEGLLSSVFSTLGSLRQAFFLLSSRKNRPDVLILNGPATAVSLCLVATLLNLVGVSDTRIVYIESLARVHGLSLSGKLCYYFSHRFLVQWASLQELYPRAEYYGVLV